MRLAFVVTGGFDRSGRERIIPALLTLVDRLARRHDVTVFVLRHEPQPCTYMLCGARVEDLGRPEGAWRQYAALRDALERTGPWDVLHAYWALPAGLATSAAGRRLHIPAIVTFDSGEYAAMPDLGYGGYGLQRHRRQRLAVSLTARLATRLTVSTGYMEGLARAHGARPERIPLGVDGTRFTPPAQSDGPPWRLIHVASLNAVKDQTTLLHAVRHLADRLPAVHLDIVGEDRLGGAMQALADRLGLSSLVTFHGFRASEEVAALLQRAHLHLLSSRHEAACVAVLEAAACGVPTVGTAVGYVADWSPERAIAVPPGDAAALAAAAAHLLEHAEARRALADAARAWTLAHDVDYTAAAFERLYEQVRAG